MKLQPKTKPTRRDAREALSEVAAIRAAYWGDVNRWGYRGGRARVVVVVR